MRTPVPPCVPIVCKELDGATIVECKECQEIVCSLHSDELQYQAEFKAKLCDPCFRDALRPLGFYGHDAAAQIAGISLLSLFTMASVATLSDLDNWSPAVATGALCVAAVVAVTYVCILQHRMAVLKWTEQQRRLLSKED